MNLFFDEDMGKGIPEALRAVGLRNVHYLRHYYRRRLRGGGSPIQDEEWIPLVGRSGWLAFSSNLGILAAEGQRELLISENVGVVFLTTGKEKSPDVLKLILNRWEWLQAIDRINPALSRIFSRWAVARG